MRKTKSKKNLKFILIAVLSILFSISFLTASRIAEAQILGGNEGYACTNHYGNCSSGQGNFKQDLSSGKIPFYSDGHADDSLQNVLNALDAKYGQNSNYLCYDIGKITAVFWGAGRQSDYPGDDTALTGNKAGIGSQADIHFPLMCTGTFSDYQKSDQYLNPKGCCPTNYKLVTQGFNGFPGETEGVAAAEPAECCLVTNNSGNGNPANGTPITYDSRKSNDYEKCTNSNGDSVWEVPALPNGTPTFIVPNPLDGANFTLGGTYLGPVGTNPYIHVPTQTPTGAPVDCNNAKGGCALVAKTGGTNDITGGGITYSVVKTDDLDQDIGKNLVCTRCFQKGDAMMLEDPGPSNSNTQKLILCDPQNTGLVDRQDIIGNVAITKGSLITDAANKSLYDACYQSGGIYIAIGCIDPTPTGIITGIIRIALGVMGGIALLQLIYAGVMYQLGDEAKIKEARDRVIATITGLAVLIFSVLILRIIGINILDVLPVNSF